MFCCGGRGFVWVIGLWGHWLVLIRVALIAFIIFLIKGAREIGFYCKGRKEWGEVGDKGHGCFLAGHDSLYSWGFKFQNEIFGMHVFSIDP
jgi:hypothetical protein